MFARIFKVFLLLCVSAVAAYYGFQCMSAIGRAVPINQGSVTMVLTVLAAVVGAVIGLKYRSWRSIAWFVVGAWVSGYACLSLVAFIETSMPKNETTMPLAVICTPGLVAVTSLVGYLAGRLAGKHEGFRWFTGLLTGVCMTAFVMGIYALQAFAEERPGRTILCLVATAVLCGVMTYLSVLSHTRRVRLNERIVTASNHKLAEAVKVCQTALASLKANQDRLRSMSLANDHAYVLASNQRVIDSLEVELETFQRRLTNRMNRRGRRTQTCATIDLSI